jgi:hypothetical protein
MIPGVERNDRDGTDSTKSHRVRANPSPIQSRDDMEEKASLQCFSFMISCFYYFPFLPKHFMKLTAHAKAAGLARI